MCIVFIFVDGGAQRKWTDMCGKDSPVPLGGEGKSRLPELWQNVPEPLKEFIPLSW